ncbi:MAG: retroviral-like aspartic protease family protein [Elusimicrobia bacterium]|nr:retroviral-like aspartic protease family protein [Elusimicrobiota bacterium]
MGEIKVRVRLENAGDLLLKERGKLGKQKVRAADIEAVVDTGAVMMLLPQDLVENLGLDLAGKTVVTLADETKAELAVARIVAITIAGRTWMTDCLVGPPACEALIGQLVLERLDLILDPIKRTLTPRPESPYLPNLKLK